MDIYYTVIKDSPVPIAHFSLNEAKSHADSLPIHAEVWHDGEIVYSNNK